MFGLESSSSPKSGLSEAGWSDSSTGFIVYIELLAALHASEAILVPDQTLGYRLYLLSLLSSSVISVSLAFSETWKRDLTFGLESSSSPKSGLSEASWSDSSTGFGWINIMSDEEADGVTDIEDVENDDDLLWLDRRELILVVKSNPAFMRGMKRDDDLLSQSIMEQTKQLSSLVAANLTHSSNSVLGALSIDKVIAQGVPVERHLECITELLSIINQKYIKGRQE
ncbi:uncharacterized protein [Temnothorax nylanderi]|uniref:uncharacterized protein n=1 Tax=Temnothorax nylanderi TaxID=102681 RepID=UPI003A8AEEA7